MSFAAQARPDRDSSFWAMTLKIAVRELRASAVKVIFAGIDAFGDPFHAARWKDCVQ